MYSKNVHFICHKTSNLYSILYDNDLLLLMTTAGGCCMLSKIY